MIKGSIVALTLTLGLVNYAQAGCLTGAAVGGVVGHMAGHHGIAGAAVGCAVGHHSAAKKERDNQRSSDSQGNQGPSH